MTSMLTVPLATDGTWTLLAAGPIAYVQLVGAPNGWELSVGTSLPLPATAGMPVASVDGSFSTSSLEATDNVYARPFGRAAGYAQTISGLKN